MSNVNERKIRQESQRRRQSVLWIVSAVLGMLTVYAGMQSSINSENCPTHPDIDSNTLGGRVYFSMEPSECEYMTDQAGVERQISAALGLANVIKNPDFLGDIEVGYPETNPGLVTLSFQTVEQRMLMGVDVDTLTLAIEDNSTLQDENSGKDGVWWSAATILAGIGATYYAWLATRVGGIPRFDSRSSRKRKADANPASEDIAYVSGGFAVDARLLKKYRPGIRCSVDVADLPYELKDANERLERAIKAGESMLRSRGLTGQIYSEKERKHVPFSPIFDARLAEARKVVSAMKKQLSGKVIDVVLNDYLAEEAAIHGSYGNSYSFDVGYVWGWARIYELQGYAESIHNTVNNVYHDARHSIQMVQTDNAIANQAAKGFREIQEEWEPKIETAKSENSGRKPLGDGKPVSAGKQVIDTKFKKD